MSPAATTIKRWMGDIVAFVRENFDVEPDAWQVDALRAFADPAIPRVSLQACVGPGKSTVMAWCVLWFLSTQGEKGEHPKGIAVSITQDNLRDGLWAELSKWRSRSRFLMAAFEWTSTRIFAKDHPETWFIAARTWPRTASAEEQGKTLAGIHAKYVAAFIDESGAIPSTVARAADQMLSGCAFGCLIQSGNPNSLEGMLYEAAVRQRHLWHVIRVTGDPDDPKRSPRIDIEWARQQIATYGRENPWVMSNILGQFPPSSLNALLGIEDVQSAMSRHLPDEAFSWAQKRLGVDVARFGDDRTVIFPRQGLAAFQPQVMRHARNSTVSVDIANRIMQARLHWGAEMECIDGTGGWAAGTVDILRSNGLTPIDVQFAAQAYDPRYENRRAEIWFGMAEWVKRGGALPPVPELVGELTTPTYTFSKRGKFLLEEKEQVKKRLGRSPDLADALALTFGMPDMPGEVSAGTLARYAQGGKALTEFDPYAMVTA